MPRGGKIQERLPLEPLMALYPDKSFRGLAEVCGVAPSYLSGIRDKGMTLYMADRIACTRLGLHPSQVWGDLWWEATPIVS